MSILPFGNRGTFFQGYDGHCASRLDAPIQSTAAHDTAIRVILPALPAMVPPVGGELYKRRKEEGGRRKEEGGRR
jgi:hypothetical protein